MLSKEEVVTLFKEYSSYKRVDLMCTLLNMCLPFEVRFLGTCLEELGKRDYSQLRESESRANNQAELAEISCVADKHARRLLTVYLSLLHSTNQTCSGLIFKTLASLANNDYAELGQALSRVSSGAAAADEAPPAPEDNPLEELLLLYTMAHNHPAFTFEQKALFGNILVRLQEEEAKATCPPKRIVCHVKTGMPPMYMPCAPCTISPDGSGAVAQHFAPVPGKSYLLPATAVATGRFAGDMGKGLQDMTGSYFVTTPMFCSVPPSNMMSPPMAPAPGTTSDFTVCPPTPYIMPAMSQPPCPQPDIVNVPYPVNDSPYASPIASPPRSPNVSRCESPVVWNAGTVQPASNYKNCYTSPNHNENSSSSSTCSGGSTGGGGGGSAYRNSRSSNHPRNKQNVPNGEVDILASLNHPMKLHEPLRIPGEESLPEVMSSMTIGTVNGVVDPSRGQRTHPDDKRCMTGTSVAPNSAGSSQSGTPSPPITPPQEESWESCNYKDDSGSARWDKSGRGVSGMPSGASRFHHQRGPPMRRVEGAKGTQRQQQPPPSTQPPPMHQSFFLPTLQPVANGTALYPVNSHAWATASTTDGKLFQHSPFFLPLMPAHGGASGPASFPPSYSTPNGNMQPPPDYMTMQSAPPPSQKSPPPFQHHYMPPNKQSSPPQHYAHPYPPPLPASNLKETCFNCGGKGHRGGDCTDPSLQDVLKKGMYHLDYSSPASTDAGAGAGVMVGSVPPPAALEK